MVKILEIEVIIELLFSSNREIDARGASVDDLREVMAGSREVKRSGASGNVLKNCLTSDSSECEQLLCKICASSRILSLREVRLIRGTIIRVVARYSTYLSNL